MRDVDRGIMRSIFINGLKGELQVEIKSLELDSLAEIKDRALMLEERNKEWKGGGVAPTERGGGFFHGTTYPRSGIAGKAPGGSRETSELKLGEDKKLSQVELEERSRNGLCFKCGE